MTGPDEDAIDPHPLSPQRSLATTEGATSHALAEHAPDDAALGFISTRPEALRYSGGQDYVSETPDDGEAGALLRRMIPDGARVLDVGSGAGAQIVAITRGKRNAVVCVEPDLRRAAAARARGLEVHECIYDEGAARRLGLFDVVVLSDVLEHMQSPAAMLEAAKRSLRPGGVILASTPNVAHWSIRLSLLRGRFDYTEDGLMDATHLRWFTEKTLRGLFARQGFAIDNFEHSLGAWLPAYRGRIPYRLRKTVLSALLPLAPRLFGCQHVLKARLAH